MKKVNVSQCAVIFLSLLSIIMTIIQLTIKLPSELMNLFLKIDVIIWLFFVIQYILRLAKRDKKWEFIKNNKIDLIPLIPFYSFMRIFRAIHIVKVFQFFEVLQLTGMFSVLVKQLSTFIRLNKLNYIFVITIVAVLLGAGGMTVFENISFWDSFWWSLVTVTTVGYGDFIPETFLGRTVAACLMFTGVGIFGAMAGTFSSYIFTRRLQSKLIGNSKIAAELIDRLKDFDEMDLDEFKEIICLLEQLKIMEKNRNTEE